MTIPAGEYLRTGIVLSESEFLTASGACGPVSIAMAARWAKNDPRINGRIVFNELRAAKPAPLCGPTGVMTTTQIRQALTYIGVRHQTHLGPGETPLNFVRRFTSGYTDNAGWEHEQGMCIAYLSNGQSLRDYLTGQGQDAFNLRGHFITLIGYCTLGVYSKRLGLTVPEGFFALDSDNNTQNPIIANTRRHRGPNPDVVYYPTTVLQQAGLADAVVVWHNL